MHLLLVDDDNRIRELLRQYLAKEGYQVSVAENAQTAERLLTSFAFDLIVLDVMMPGEDGMSFAKRLRQKNDIPILMLTAKGNVEDRIAGLSVGVDDFVAKPFDPRELVLRIEAISRRQASQASIQNIVKFGSFIYNIKDGNLENDGVKIDLTRSEKDLLSALANQAEEPKSREELAIAMNVDALQSRAVDVQITRLRKKIETDPKTPRYILTIRGLGYQLNTAP